MAAAAIGALYLLRRVGRRSGVTGLEAAGDLPGDDIVVNPMWRSTRAITIDAAPERIWPWVVQMGFPSHRAGWYTRHWLDRLTFGIEEQSADGIVPELQQLEVGDRVPDCDDWSVFFTVAAVEPPHALVLHSTRHVIKPIETIDFSWAFVIRELSPERSRLFVRARTRYTPRQARPFVELVIGPADFVNAGAMLRGIKKRVETAGVRPVQAEVHDPGVAMEARDAWSGLREIAAASPLFLFAPFYRRRHLRWGATDEEVAGSMPGDELVPQSSFMATRAITIDAPPEQVWPWLVQIGYGRAGFYSYDLFDNAGRPSAEQILPEHQHPSIGDWVPMAAKVNETTAFKISSFEPNRFMLWEKPHSTWAWKLEPIAGRRTRLITRLKDHHSWRKDPAGAMLTLILFEFGDFPMMRKLLLGVKRRAEARRADDRRLGQRTAVRGGRRDDRFEPAFAVASADISRGRAGSSDVDHESRGQQRSPHRSLRRRR
jgi:hypothetical protein